MNYIYVLVLLLSSSGKPDGRVIHAAFTNSMTATLFAAQLEPVMKKSRKDFDRCLVIPVPLIENLEPEQVA